MPYNKQLCQKPGFLSFHPVVAKTFLSFHPVIWSATSIFETFVYKKTKKPILSTKWKLQSCYDKLSMLQLKPTITPEHQQWSCHSLVLSYPDYVAENKFQIMWPYSYLLYNHIQWYEIKFLWQLIIYKCTVYTDYILPTLVPRLGAKKNRHVTGF